MTDSTSYSVITSGDLQIGYERAEVQNALIAQFSIPVDKAGRIVNRRQVMRKNIDHESAMNYKKKLEDIGMVVILKKDVS